MQTSANTTSPALTWDDDTAHLGWVTVAGTTWIVHTHVDADRYAKYDRDLAAYPATVTTPDWQLIAYPVPDKESATPRVLLHAPAFLAERRPHLAGPIAWQPRKLANGRTVHHAEVATVEFLDERIPVFARVDEDMSAAYGDGFPGVVATNQTETGRELVVYVPSMDTTRGEVFRILAELGRID
ncbi:hypothetical protein [Nocardiopsis synnemataformans]|uniref:hypothetical protein n=1 Tax=Nocardiopsis synnemataformans TaxID=61305 RepID=UPI003EBEEFBF